MRFLLDENQPRSLRMYPRDSEILTIAQHKKVMRAMAKRFEAVLSEQLEDPLVRAHWERTAVARAVAISILRYRSEQSLSQKQLAERLGWKQAQVARLELGEHTPTLETLVHLSRRLGLEFCAEDRDRPDAARA